jgi:hypothetical protein
MKISINVPHFANVVQLSHCWKLLQEDTAFVFLVGFSIFFQQKLQMKINLTIRNYDKFSLIKKI